MRTQTQSDRMVSLVMQTCHLLSARTACVATALRYRGQGGGVTRFRLTSWGPASQVVVSKDTTPDASLADQGEEFRKDEVTVFCLSM